MIYITYYDRYRNNRCICILYIIIDIEIIIDMYRNMS